MVSRMTFVECGGNSAPLFSNEPMQANVQALHGLVSCAEWTGVMLSTLLEEAGIDPKAKWLIAEGADSLALSRSVPITKALDDAMIALYQNGERLMPGNGYPMRLLLPGWEGNMNVKWLRRIKLVEAPAMSYYEARTYAPILPNGKAYQFYFLQEVKSFITHPSPGLTLSGPGFYEISGVAYSANGRIAKVMVSADGGKSWAQAALQEPVHPKAFTRFRVPWRWDGGPAVLQSRAWDEAGNVQPTRAPSSSRGAARPAGGPERRWRSRASTTTALTSWASRAQRRGETCLRVMLSSGVAPWLRWRRIVIALALASSAAFAQAPNLGKPISRGRHRGLGHQHPAGRLRPAARQRHARAGRTRSLPQKCAVCHGENGKGGTSAALVGGAPLTSGIETPKTIANFWPYATTLFDFTRRAMPWQQPRTLTNDEVYALTAYILSLNKIIGENDVMNARRCPKCGCRTATASSSVFRTRCRRGVGKAQGSRLKSQVSGLRVFRSQVRDSRI